MSGIATRLLNAGRATLRAWRRPLLLSSVAALQACGGGDAPAPSRPPLLGEPPAACAAADLSKLQTTVFVSTTGSDSATCGATVGKACKSVQQGIANCNGPACGVLVGQGVYALETAAAGLPRNVVVRNGVSVVGSCVFDGSADPRYRSVLRGPAGLPAVSAAGIGSATLLHGFVVIGGSSSAADGAASVAMAVDASPALTLRNLRVIGGPGAPGAVGRNGDNTRDGCDTGGAPASCSTRGGQQTGPQTGFFDKATSASGTGGDGGAGTATGQSLPPDATFCSSGGKGGQHGGASIGMVLSDSPLSLDPSVVMYASRAGDGGTGGSGGLATHGGGGAGGSGGNGGSSFGLVSSGSSPMPAADQGVYAGTAGTGAAASLNAGASLESRCIAANGSAGRAGVSVAAYRVGSNWLTQQQGPFKGVGRAALAPSQQLRSAEGKWFVTMQPDGNLVLSDLGGVWWQQGGSVTAGSQLVWVTDSLCVVPSPWCAGGGFTPPQLPSPFGPSAFLAVEEGRLAIYDAAGALLWLAGPY